MKALFITTKTGDCINHVKAWEAAYGPPVHVTFNHEGIRNDHVLVEAVEAARPDIVFYIGAMRGSGVPRSETFRTIRLIAPIVNFCSDSQDMPWHPVLNGYARLNCFNLQVGIDGPDNAPVDLATLTPVDFRELAGNVKKDIRFGFSGSVGNWNGRSEIVKALEWFGGLTVMRRSAASYSEHANFMKRCWILLNVSMTGSGARHHVKGRVLEAGWAKCALLESDGSLIGNWFPSDCYLTYKDPVEAAELAKSLDDSTIERMASRLNEEVVNRFHPKIIYGEILNRVIGTNRGAIRNVGSPKQITTA